MHLLWNDPHCKTFADRVQIQRGRKKNHNISSNLYEIIGPDCHLENITAFLKVLKLEKNI